MSYLSADSASGAQGKNLVEFEQLLGIALDRHIAEHNQCTFSTAGGELDLLFLQEPPKA